MKNILCALLFISQFSFAQNPLVKQWDYRFGGTNQDYLYCFQQTADGGFILGGYSRSGISGDKTQPVIGGYDYWIVKTDSLGSKEWEKDFGGTNDDYLLSLQQTNDGGYILGGYSNSPISGDKTQDTIGGYDYWIVKTDSLGNKEWDKNFGGSDFDVLRCVKQTVDGGYMMGGQSRSGSSVDKTQSGWGQNDFWIIKTDSLGNKIWDKDLGGTGDDQLFSLQQTADGGYIFGGDSWSQVNGDKSQTTWGYDDYWIVKTDSLGNKQWDKDFGGTSWDGFSSLQQTADGGYILAGISESIVSGDKTQPTWGNYSQDYWIVKTDSLGNKQWDKDFGGTAEEPVFGNISQTIDHGYLLAGTSDSPISGDKTESNLGGDRTWVLKTDSLGNKQWDKTPNTISTDKDGDGLGLQTKDGCYVIAMYTLGGIGADKTQPCWGLNDYWLIKFCDTTRAISGVDEMNTDANISIYPNPSSGNFTIELNEVSGDEISIDVVNTLGQNVFSSSEKVSSTHSKKGIDLKEVASGVYFIEIKTANEFYRKKIMIEN